MFKCCVDIGYAAHDTTGNAEETKAWASANGFSRLIIVTSSYHMPRSLVELGRAMPATTLVPYPVVSRNFRTERWWLHAATARAAVLRVREVPAFRRPLLYVARLLQLGRQRACRQRRPARFERLRRATMLRSLVFLVVFYVNTAVFLVLGSWLLLAPRRWAMEGLRLHGLASLWWLKVICGTRFEVRGAREAAQGRLPGRLQASVGLGHVRADPGVPRSGHGDEGRARLDSALRLVQPQVPAHLRQPRPRARARSRP